MFLFTLENDSVHSFCPNGLMQNINYGGQKQKFQSIMAGNIKPEQSISHHGGQERKGHKQEGTQARLIFPSMCTDEAFLLTKHQFPKFHTLSVIYSDFELINELHFISPQDLTNSGGGGNKTLNSTPRDLLC